MLQIITSQPPTVRRFLAGVLFNALGSGLVLPILVIYLHNIAGLSILAASAVISFEAIVGLCVSPVVGTVVDRIGPKPVLLFGIAMAVVGSLGWIIVRGAMQAYVVSVIAAVANSAMWPPQHTMMARMVNEADRSRLFGLQFMMLNLGLGIGGIVGSTIVDVSDERTFTLLFTIDALSFVGFFLFIVSLTGVGKKPFLELTAEQQRHGYRQVFADKIFMRLSVATLIMLICGYASLEAGLPVLLTEFGGLSVKSLGFIWAVNTAVIVACQVYVLNRIEGTSRTRLMGFLGVLWACSWLLLLAGIHLPPLGTFIIAGISMAIFGIGETIWSPIGATLVNALAPEHLRGRYSAFASTTWVVSQATGPLISGAMLDLRLPNVWLLIVMSGTLLAGILAVRLGKYLTVHQDGRFASEISSK